MNKSVKEILSSAATLKPNYITVDFGEIKSKKSKHGTHDSTFVFKGTIPVVVDKEFKVADPELLEKGATEMCKLLLKNSVFEDKTVEVKKRICKELIGISQSLFIRDVSPADVHVIAWAIFIFLGTVFDDIYEKFPSMNLKTLEGECWGFIKGGEEECLNHVPTKYQKLFEPFYKLYFDMKNVAQETSSSRRVFEVQEALAQESLTWHTTMSFVRENRESIYELTEEMFTYFRSLDDLPMCGTTLLSHSIGLVIPEYVKAHLLHQRFYIVCNLLAAHFNDLVSFKIDLEEPEEVFTMIIYYMIHKGLSPIEAFEHVRNRAENLVKEALLLVSLMLKEFPEVQDIEEYCRVALRFAGNYGYGAAKFMKDRYKISNVEFISQN